MDAVNSISEYFIKKYLINKIQYLQVKPDLEKAIEFYQTHVLDCNAQLEPLLETYRFPSRLPFWKWELFAAILVGDVCRSYTNEGADLTRYEVKSRHKTTAFRRVDPPGIPGGRKPYKSLSEKARARRQTC